MNKKFLAIALAIAIIIGFFVWYSTAGKRSDGQENKIISKNGIHWHFELSIIIKGKKQEIPANIGLGAIHLPLHTHETDNIIHMEFSRAVRENDLKLGKFFKIWGKEFNKEGIVKMLVNGKENGGFENYIMRNNDKIEIRYE